MKKKHRTAHLRVRDERETLATGDTTLRCDGRAWYEWEVIPVVGSGAKGLG
ncbi:MAG TPA: hypothetical protein VGK73_30655 [Polyangiaceae bacterium]